VGLTGMLLEQKINKDNFEIINEFYRSDMSKFNSKKEKGEKGSLKRKLDFQFILMRHWSLYESALNSSYMVSKLNLWDQNGIDKFHELLHLIGISLSEAKQLFKFMPKDTVEKLETRIFTYAENPRFNLLDIAFESYSKQVDYCV
jgi:cell division control protein 45